MRITDMFLKLYTWLWNKHDKSRVTGEDNYVLGFAFNNNRTKVALSEIKLTVTQYSNLNGIGGKMSPTETPVDAMIRLFRERTGYPSLEKEWEKIDILVDSDELVHIYCYCIDLPEDIDITTISNPRVQWYDIEKLHHYELVKPANELIQFAIHSDFVKKSSKCII